MLDWQPIGPPDPSVAEDAATVSRQWSACSVFGSTGERNALQSPWLTAHGPRGTRFGNATTRDGMLADLAYIDDTRALGDALFTGDLLDFAIETGQFTVEQFTSGTVSENLTTIPLVDRAVMLADGRMAIPLATLVPTGYEYTWPYDWLFIKVDTLRQVDGQWVLDDRVSVCVGNCDAARAQYVDQLVSMGIEVPGTPVATPKVSTPVADLAPVSADECAVAPLTSEELSARNTTPPANARPRTYGPVSTGESVWSVEVIAAAREWHGCVAYGESMQARAMESNRYLWEARSGQNETVDSLLARQQAVTTLANDILNPDWRHYLIETSTLPNDSDAEAFAVVQPGDLAVLNDGRMAVVVSTLVPEGTIAERTGLPGFLPTVEIQVYARSAAQGYRWLLDERLIACAGDCGPHPANGATCSDATAIHTEPINAQFVRDTNVPEQIPWILADTSSDDVVLVGLLWYGDRPLEPGGVFAEDEFSAKFMWVSDPELHTLSLTAVNTSEPGSKPITMQVNAASAGRTIYTMYMDFPVPGCWEVTVTGTVLGTGEPVTATVVMEVIAPPSGTPSTPDSTPASPAAVGEGWRQ